MGWAACAGLGFLRLYRRCRSCKLLTRHEALSPKRNLNSREQARSFSVDSSADAIAPTGRSPLPHPFPEGRGDKGEGLRPSLYELPLGGHGPQGLFSAGQMGLFDLHLQGQVSPHPGRQVNMIGKGSSTMSAAARPSCQANAEPLRWIASAASGNSKRSAATGSAVMTRPKWVGPR